MSQIQTSTLRIKESLKIVQSCLTALVCSPQAGIEAVFLISDQGLLVLSAYQGPRNKDDEDQLSAMTASIVAQISSAMKRMGRKRAKQLTIETPVAYIIISPISSDLIILVISNKTVQYQGGAGLGLVYGLIKATIERIQGIL
ncbi:MAG: roadblock/LC7 domain-containing protein [Candidatus Hodarchaeota archaeon]